MKLTLDLEVNSEMEEYEACALLHTIAERVGFQEFHKGHTQSILDTNGNRVGSWKVEA